LFLNLVSIGSYIHTYQGWAESRISCLVSREISCFLEVSYLVSRISYFATRYFQPILEKNVKNLGLFKERNWSG